MRFSSLPENEAARRLDFHLHQALQYSVPTIKKRTKDLLKRGT